MEIVIIEKTAFDMLLAGVKALEDRVRTLAEKGGDRRLAEWMDTEDVCRMLSITPKTLQAMRDRHGIAYSQIGILCKMNDNVLTKDCGVLADAMQSVRRSLKMADRLADGYIPPMGGERYLTDRDLARRLHVSRRTLQQYRHEGILPYFLFGGKTLYRESDIQKVLERNYRKAY